jgi:hypothetical protein
MSTLFDDLPLPGLPPRRPEAVTADPAPASQADRVAALVADLNPQQRAAVEHRGGRRC